MKSTHIGIGIGLLGLALGDMMFLYAGIGWTIGAQTEQRLTEKEEYETEKEKDERIIWNQEE